MRLIQKLSGLFLASCLSFSTTAQDFNTQVTINTPKIQSVDPKIFKSLETAIEEFMNTRNWIEDNFEPEERIELNIVITINKELSHFYAYVILGMDYDSFSELGGENYLQKAQDILNSVPRGTADGWTVTGIVNRSRYWIIENLLNPRMQDMRRAMYQYYMLGLDRVAQEDQTEKGLTAILNALETIDAANQSNPNSMWVQLFSDAKKDEIINLFSVADFNTKRKVYGIMVKLDGTRANDYRVLLK